MGRWLAEAPGEGRHIMEFDGAGGLNWRRDTGQNVENFALIYRLSADAPALQAARPGAAITILGFMEGPWRGLALQGSVSFDGENAFVLALSPQMSDATILAHTDAAAAYIWRFRRLTSAP